MKKLGDMGANPTIQIDVVDLDEVKLEAMIAEAPASTPALDRSRPPPLPPSALEPRQPPAMPVAEAQTSPRSNLVLVVALVACLAVSFGVVALLRMRSAEAPTPTPAPNPTTSPSVITVPTVDMNDEPAAR